MLDMEEFLVLRDLFNQGWSISEIARKTCHSRVTVRKYIHSQIPPTPEKRSKRPSKLDDYKEYIDQRLQDYPLTAARIYREIQEQGFAGKYTIVKDYVREVRPKIGVPAVYIATRRSPESRPKSTGQNAVISRSTDLGGSSTVLPWSSAILG